LLSRWRTEILHPKISPSNNQHRRRGPTSACCFTRARGHLHSTRVPRKSRAPSSDIVPHQEVQPC
jgi:hypothetical protein